MSSDAIVNICLWLNVPWEYRSRLQGVASTYRIATSVWCKNISKCNGDNKITLLSSMILWLWRLSIRFQWFNNFILGSPVEFLSAFSGLAHYPLDDALIILKVESQNKCYGLSAWTLMELVSGESCFTEWWWLNIRDDVIKWKHFPRYWSFVRGIHWWIPLTNASDAELWCFLVCAWIKAGQTIRTPLIWEAIALIMASLWWVQVMVWCCQATSHCPGYCWPRSMSPCGDVTN